MICYARIWTAADRMCRISVLCNQQTISVRCLYTYKGYSINVLVCSGCWIGCV
jgi:hypothetical protein